MVLVPKVSFLVAIGMALTVVHAEPIPIRSQRAPKIPFFNNKGTCNTPECIQAAKEIIDDMNPQADPCRDFSQFACGGFMEKRTIAADQSAINYFQVLYDHNIEAIRTIVDPEIGKSPSPAKGDTAAQANLRKLQDLYVSCMNEDAILKAGRKSLVHQINSILASFPSNGTSDKTVVGKTLAQLSNQALSGFVTIGVSPDPTNPLIYAMVVGESGLGLPSKEYYQDAETAKLYESTIGQMFQIVFGEEDAAFRTQPLNNTDVAQQWRDVAKGVLDFETQLAAIGTDLSDRYDPIKAYNPRTVAEISSMTLSVDWEAFISGVLPKNINNTRPIIVESLTYLTKLETLLNNTSPQTLHNYFAWVAILGRAPNLGFAYRQPIHNLNAILNGVSPDIRTPRWKTCVGVINENVGDLAGHYYIQENFKGNSRQSVVSIVDSLLQAYAKTFPTLNWLDKTTLAGAMKKVKAIVQLMGYSTDSPSVASSKSLQAFYADLPITKSDYFNNQVQYSTWSTKQSMGNLNKPVNRKKMDAYPQMVNAFYNPSANQITFPAGILQRPFFHVESPDYVNYGGFGVVAGHEVTHGFDNMGHHYDSIGRLTNWWTNATEKAFNEKAKCLVDQYSNFTIKGPDGKDHNIDGKLTLGENIADNGGLKQSYRAWQSRLKTDPSGKKFKNYQLPGLEKYTREQLFFISYGRLWCSKERPEYLMQLIRTDSHSPSQSRINGVVQNSPEFSHAFKCPAGSPMNPVKKCQVW